MNKLYIIKAVTNKLGVALSHYESLLIKCDNIPTDEQIRIILDGHNIYNNGLEVICTEVKINDISLDDVLTSKLYSLVKEKIGIGSIITYKELGQWLADNKGYLVTYHMHDITASCSYVTPIWGFEIVQWDENKIMKEILTNTEHFTQKECQHLAFMHILNLI